MTVLVNWIERTRGFGLKNAALALVLLTVVTRLPALIHPRAIDDEAIYAVVADEIVDGGKPYRDAIERKPPLLFWTYAGVFRMMGKYNWPALHLFALGWTLATMAGLYQAAKQLWDREAGLAAALLYSVFGSYATWKNLAFNGEMMMNLPLAWAWAIGMRQAPSRVRAELLVAGGLLGAAFLLKQPAAIAALPLGLYLLLPSYRRSRGVSFASAVGQAAMLTLGFAGVLGLVAAILQHQGILGEAFHWTVSDHSVPYVFWNHALTATAIFVVSCAPLLVGTALACRKLRECWVGKSAEQTALIGWLVVSAVGVAAGGRFYPHYYLQLLPPLALLAAPALSDLWRKKLATTPEMWRFAVTWWTWLGVTALVFLLLQWWELASRREPSSAGRYLAAHAGLVDRVFVWGQQPEIYLDAHCRPASRFVATFPLTGYVFGGTVPGLNTQDRIVPGAWESWQRDMKAHPPAYVVDTQTDRDALYPVRNFPKLAELLTKDYSETFRTPTSVIYRRKGVATSGN